jgi:putative MATE family efflux protein
MKKIDLGSENTWSVILRLAIPAMLAQLVSVLYNIVDRIYVSNMPNDGALALVGIGVVSPIATFISSFAFWVGLGGAPLFSISLGEKNEEKAKKILSNAFLLLIILSALLMIVFYSVMKPMLYAFGASDASYPFARDYLVIYLIGTFFSVISLGLNQFLSAQGESLKAMITTISACLLNVGLDPLFMYAFNLGIRGAAIATILCQLLSFCLALIFLLKGSRIKLSFGQYDIRVMKSIFRLGFSPFIIMATDSVITILLNSMLKRFGGDKGDYYIEVATIVCAFFSLVTGPLLGISSGTQPLLGYDYGARRVDLIKKAEKQLTFFALGFCVVAFGLSFVLSKPFTRIFVGSRGDQEVIDGAVKYIRWYMYGVIPLAFQYIYVDGLTGMGQAKYSIWLSMNRKIVLLVPAIIFLPMITGSAAYCFLAEPIADACSGIFSLVAYRIITPRILRKRWAENTDSLPKNK